MSKSGLRIAIIEALPKCLSSLVEYLRAKGVSRVLSASALIDLVLGRLGQLVPRKRVGKARARDELRSYLWLEKSVSLYLGATISALFIEGRIEVGSERVDRVWRAALRGRGVLKEVNSLVAKYLALAAGLGNGIAFVNPVPYRALLLLEVVARRKALDRVAITKWGELEPIDAPRGDVVRLGILAVMGGASVGSLPITHLETATPRASGLNGEVRESLELSLGGEPTGGSAIDTGKEARARGSRGVRRYLRSSTTRAEVLVKGYSSLLTNVVDVEVRNRYGLDPDP